MTSIWAKLLWLGWMWIIYRDIWHISVAVIAVRAYQRACCLCQVLCSYQPKMLVLRLAYCRRTCSAPCPPERQCHHRRVEVTEIHIFRNKVFSSSRWFLDIDQKSVRLKLKGVKIIRRYRDLFQLIRYLFQLIYSGFSNWELMWFCIVVHRHLPASVKCKRISVTIGALVTLCLLCHSSF